MFATLTTRQEHLYIGSTENNQNNAGPERGVILSQDGMGRADDSVDQRPRLIASRHRLTRGRRCKTKPEVRRVALRLQYSSEYPLHREEDKQSGCGRIANQQQKQNFVVGVLSRASHGFRKKTPTAILAGENRNFDETGKYDDERGANLKEGADDGGSHLGSTQVFGCEHALHNEKSLVS